MKSISLEQFYTNYFIKFPNSSYRLGMYFCDLFVESSVDMAYTMLIYTEDDIEECKELIWNYLLTHNICCNNIPVLREELL